MEKVRSDWVSAYKSKFKFTFRLSRGDVHRDR